MSQHGVTKLTSEGNLNKKRYATNHSIANAVSSNSRCTARTILVKHDLSRKGEQSQRLLRKPPDHILGNEKPRPWLMQLPLDNGNHGTFDRSVPNGGRIKAHCVTRATQMA